MFWELKKYIEILRTSYTTLSQKDVLSLSEDDILEHYNIYPKIAQDLNAWAKVNAELFRGSIKNSSDNAELQIDDAKIDSWVKTYSENILSNYKWIDEKDKVRDTLRGLSDTVPS